MKAMPSSNPFMAIVKANGHTVYPGIEIAAQATRTIPFLDRGWWSTYPRRDAADLVGPLQIFWERGRPADQPYSSAWENAATGHEVIDEEWALVERSVQHLCGKKIPSLA